MQKPPVSLMYIPSSPSYSTSALPVPGPIIDQVTIFH